MASKKVQDFTEKFRRFSSSSGKAAKRILRRSNIFSDRASVRRKDNSKSCECSSFSVTRGNNDSSYCNYNNISNCENRNADDPKFSMSCDIDGLGGSFIPIERLLSGRSFNSKSSFTRADTGFLDLNDHCMLKIFAKLSIHDICNLRLVDKRLNLLIQRHSSLLPRKHRIEMILYGKAKGLIDFERPLERCLTDVSMKNDDLDKVLRHIVVDRCLCVEGVSFNTSLRHAIQRSQVDCLYEVNLSNCHLNISANELASFIALTGLLKLSIENCSFQTETVVSDEMFSYRTYLHTFSVTSKSVQTFPALTCSTLLRWSNSETLPAIIILNNVQCSFTIFSIVKMIKSYICRCYSDSVENMRIAQSLLWNFGLVNVSVADAVVATKAIGPCVEFLKQWVDTLSIWNLWNGELSTKTASRKSILGMEKQKPLELEYSDVSI
uniref:F-box domain-containing protein n=1 Tax=Syphacia muris TaxID=451379 RepID=A0A0N5AIT7_9BILA